MCCRPAVDFLLFKLVDKISLKTCKFATRAAPAFCLLNIWSRSIVRSVIYAICQFQYTKSYFDNYNSCFQIFLKKVHVSCQIKLFKINPIYQIFDYLLMNTLFKLNEHVPFFLEHVTNSPRDFAEIR